MYGDFAKDMKNDCRPTGHPLGREVDEKLAAMAADTVGEALGTPYDLIRPQGNSAAGISIGAEASNLKAIFTRPRLGQTVLVDTGTEVNGTRIHPAIVTRVWGPFCVNVRVLLDGQETLWRTSLMHKSQVPPPSSYQQPRPVYWFHEHDGPPIS